MASLAIGLSEETEKGLPRPLGKKEKLGDLIKQPHGSGAVIVASGPRDWSVTNLSARFLAKAPLCLTGCTGRRVTRSCSRYGIGVYHSALKGGWVTVLTGGGADPSPLVNNSSTTPLTRPVTPVFLTGD